MVHHNLLGHYYYITIVATAIKRPFSRWTWVGRF